MLEVCEVSPTPSNSASRDTITPHPGGCHCSHFQCKKTEVPRTTLSLRLQKWAGVGGRQRQNGLHLPPGGACPPPSVQAPVRTGCWAPHASPAGGRAARHSQCVLHGGPAPTARGDGRACQPVSHLERAPAAAQTFQRGHETPIPPRAWETSCRQPRGQGASWRYLPVHASDVASPSAESSPLVWGLDPDVQGPPWPGMNVSPGRAGRRLRAPSLSWVKTLRPVLGPLPAREAASRPAGRRDLPGRRGVGLTATYLPAAGRPQ